MDPNGALEEARRAAHGLLTGDAGEEGSAGYNEAAIDLATAFQALDGWLQRGGFLPAAWRNGRAA